MIVHLARGVVRASSVARPPRAAWIVGSTIDTDPEDGLGDGVDFGMGVGVGVGVSVGAATNGVGWSDGAVDGVTTGDGGARAMCWAPAQRMGGTGAHEPCLSSVVSPRK